MRFLLPPDELPFDRKSNWPAKWVAPSIEQNDRPRVVAYRRAFNLAVAEKLRIHVSADERYDLWLDGVRTGRGPERGDRLNWFFETYELSLAAGQHVIVARTWWLGPHAPAPFAQMTVRHGFLLVAEKVPAELLNTGIAEWACKPLGGYEWLPTGAAWGAGAKVRIIGENFNWGFELGGGDGWSPVVPIADAVTADENDQPLTWRLRPALLPPMREVRERSGVVRHVANAEAFPFHDDPYQPQPPVNAADQLVDEAASWTALLAGAGSVVIPPHTRRRVLIDFDDYQCAYPCLITDGGRGGRIRVSWAESLYEQLPRGPQWIGAMPKGYRDIIEGKFFHGVTDEFLPDGGTGRKFETLWWEAGRYVQLLVETGDDAMTLRDLFFTTTRYPLDDESAFKASDEKLVRVRQLALRSLMVGAHEVFTDSPYYEQIMYVGDTRLESLATYVTTLDARLPSKAIGLFDGSRKNEGMVQSRYPSRVTQYTWGFNLWWVAMVHDWMMWRDDVPFVRARLPGVRAAIDAALRCVGSDGLPAVPTRPNYNFIDWAVGWQGGAPGKDGGVSACNAWQLVHVLNLAADIEEATGEIILAQRHRQRGAEIAAASIKAFWSEKRGLFADDRGHSSFSEHAQALALLSDALIDEMRDRVINNLLSDPHLTRATIYFNHYLFEALYRTGKGIDRIYERLAVWTNLLDVDLRTLPEMPEPTRSDSHGWGAHVAYHFMASVLGIRPASAGFATVMIRPQLGPLTAAAGTLVHPGGPIHASFTRDGDVLHGEVELPNGLKGELDLGHGIVPITGRFSSF